MTSTKAPETLTYHAKHEGKLVFVHAWHAGYQELVFATSAQAEAWALANDLDFRARGRAKKVGGGSECSRPVEISDDCNQCHVSDALPAFNADLHARALAAFAARRAARASVDAVTSRD